jgi:hypothetical protein
MIIEIYQNGIPTRRVKPNTPIRLYAGGYPWNWFSGAHFRVTNSSGQIVLDKANIDINVLRNCWLDWYAPNQTGWYNFIPFADDPNTFVPFEIASDAVVPGDPGPGQGVDPLPGDSSGGGLPSWVIPAAAAAAILLLLWPAKK